MNFIHILTFDIVKTLSFEEKFLNFISEKSFNHFKFNIKIYPKGDPL